MEQIRFTRDLRSNSRVASEAKLAAKSRYLFVKTLSKQQSNKFQIRIAEIFVARTTKHFLCWCTGKKKLRNFHVSGGKIAFYFAPTHCGEFLFVNLIINKSDFMKCFLNARRKKKVFKGDGWCFFGGREIYLFLIF